MTIVNRIADWQLAIARLIDECRILIVGMDWLIAGL
jgi:hypothetical protein